MNILITGIAGLLGSRFAEYLIKEHPEHNIIGIDACEVWGNTINNVPKNITFYKINVSDNYIEKIFQNNNIDIVYHFAAYAAEGLSPFIRKFNYENNVISTVNIINNCIKYNIKRLIFTSSMSVYGYGVSIGKQFDENDTPMPIDPYAISKYACEMDIKVAGKQHGLDWCIIRPHNVFGRNQNVNDRYRNVLGIWMHQIINNEPITIYGDGEQTRAFTEIENICPCLYATGFEKEFSKQILNLGGLKSYTINEAANILSDITGYKNIKHYEERHEVKYAVPSSQKSIDMLGYFDKISFEDGLKNMWEWVKNSNVVHEWYLWDKFELDNKIYSYWKK